MCTNHAVAPWGLFGDCECVHFAGLLWTGKLGSRFQSHKLLGLLMQVASLAPGESAASCNPQLLPSCQIYLRNSGQHRPAQNSSGSALVKLPDDNRKINWEV